MYHCQVHFYLVGRSCKTFEIIKGSVPLDNFTHTFSESSQVEEKLASQADVIMMHLADMDIEESERKSVSAKRDSAELILLAEGAEAAFLAGEFPEEGYSAFFSGVSGGQEREEACESGPECLLAAVKDIWRLPMTEGESRFRFARWQQGYKAEKDAWQNSHFFESTINNVPNLIWYKDKNGIHEKVNDSFCRTVGKTKKQVEGRGHAYIWDVEQDDPACIESEREVMSKRRTLDRKSVV